jgi:hypothetical protein
MRHLGMINSKGRDRLITLILTPAAGGAKTPALNAIWLPSLCRTGIVTRDALVIQPPSVLTCAVPFDTSGGLA